MPLPRETALSGPADAPRSSPGTSLRPADARRPWGRRLSVRTYAFLLVLAVAVPLGALLVAALRQIADQEQDQALVSLRQTARLAAAEIDLVLTDARAALDQVATRPAVRQPEAGRCDPVFADFSAAHVPLVNLLLVDVDGRPVCSTLPPVRGPTPYRDRMWFRAVVDGQPLVVDPPHRARSDQRWIVTVAVPVRRADGSLGGVLATALDLDRLRTPSLRGGVLASDGTIDVIDPRGGLLARSTGAGAIGNRLTGDLLEKVIAQRDGGLRGVSYDGVDKVVGFAPLSTVPWIALVSMPAEDVFVQARHSALLSTFAVFAILAGILATTAILARRMLRPIRSIAGVAEAVGRGDLAARAEVSGPRELAGIAMEVNRMLDQRQRDEAALRDSEARFRQLFETSNDAIVIVDRDNRIVFANAATERVFGHRPTALAGRELSMLQPERFQQAHRQGVRRFITTGERQIDWRGTESVGLHADGRELPIEISFSYVRIGGNDVFAAFVRDISHRKRVEAELHESEARFRSLSDSAPSLIWMSAADGSCFYVNRAWCEFTGQTLEQACGDGWASSVHPDDRTALLERQDDAFEQIAPLSIEFRLRRADGEYRYVLNHAVPRRGDDGALVGYIGTCVDIHDRVWAERRNRRLSTLYAALSKANEAIARTRGTSALLQQVCDIAVQHGGFHVATVCLIDMPTATLRTVAAAGATLDFFDRTVLSLGPDEPRHEVPSLIAIRENAPYISNDREHDRRAPPIVHPVARREIQSTASLPLHQEGRVTGCLTVHAAERDYFDDEMTELLQLLAADLSFALDTMAADQRRERAEADLRQLNATLEEKVLERTRSLEAANRELEAFSYSISHDLRAPLRAIGGFTELIMDGHQDRLDHEARGYLERVRAASQRMSRLIDDLMNLCRIARVEVRRVRVDLSRVAAEVLAELQEGDPQRAVNVRIMPGLAVEADQGLAQIVLANLLGNAWKFTVKRKAPSIAFGLAEHDGEPMCFVRDNGAGFDMAHAAKLFEPFQRLHGDAEFDGTGIGLALVQRIVARHGGRVVAESAVDVGTTIWFTLAPRSP
jgi:PAS domain S-box-containing protein